MEEQINELKNIEGAIEAILFAAGYPVKYAKIAEEVAKKFGATYIDVQEDFDKHLEHRYPAYISWDRVHPNWVGSMIIATKIMKVLGAKQLF